MLHGRNVERSPNLEPRNHLALARNLDRDYVPNTSQSPPAHLARIMTVRKRGLGVPQLREKDGPLSNLRGVGAGSLSREATVPHSSTKEVNIDHLSFRLVQRVMVQTPVALAAIDTKA